MMVVLEIMKFLALLVTIAVAGVLMVAAVVGLAIVVDCIVDQVLKWIGGCGKW